MFIVANNSIVFFASLHLNQGPLVGDKPCLPVGDVALNDSSSKIDDVAVNASKVCFSVLGSLFFIVSFAHIIHFF